MLWGSVNLGIFHRREIAFLLAFKRELVAELFKFGDLFQAQTCASETRSGSGISLGAGAISQTQRHDFLQQRFVIDSAVIG